jgi:hypothetical protein
VDDEGLERNLELVDRNLEKEKGSRVSLVKDG